MPQHVGFAAYSGPYLAASVCSNAPRCSFAPVPPPALALPHDSWHRNVCQEESGPMRRWGVTYIARIHFTHHFNGNYRWDETSHLFGICRRIMQQPSEVSVHGEGKQTSPGCSWSSFDSPCFILLSDYRSHLLKPTGSKLINKYEISSHIISKDYVCIYTQRYLGMYVSYLRLLAATALCCTNLTECFDSCRLSGCWRCSL